MAASTTRRKSTFSDQVDCVEVAWRKSSHSDQSDRVEVGFWKKSSFSDQAGSDCVEVAFAETGAAVRDSKNGDGPLLSLSASAWREFVTGIK